MAKTKESKDKKKKGKPGQTEPDARRFPKIVKQRHQIPRGEHNGMRLLLIEDVPHVGKQGEVVEVKPGFGRNYLIPQGLATFVNAVALVRIDKHKAKVEAIRIARMADLKMLARELENLSISIEANATEDGHLYGSVTAADICRAVNTDKTKLKEENVQLSGPIKELGLYQVDVKLAEEVATQIKVWVVPTAGKNA